MPISYTFAVDERSQLWRIDSGDWPASLDSPPPLLGVEDQRFGRQLLCYLSQPVRDLIRVATAVYHVDRVAAQWEAGTQGTRRDVAGLREIFLSVSVEHPARWNQSRAVLERVLVFLTDDRWHLSFTPASHVQYDQLPLPIGTIPSSSEVALFSGGLDSVAGILAQDRSQRRPFVPVSLGGTGVREWFISRNVQSLRAAGLELYPLFLKHSLRGVGSGNSSQRARAFLFWSVGAAVAHTLGIDRVVAYESGPGAVNPALTEAQVGAQNTRAMHPETLRRLERLYQLVLDRPVVLDLPFLLLSKADVCRAAGSALTDAVIHCTNSCDETEAHKRDPSSHCGMCTSCLLRRAALHAALADADPTPYRCSEFGTDSPYSVHAYRLQALRLGELGSFEDLLELDPSIVRVADYAREHGATDPARFKMLFLEAMKRHASEILAFLDSAGRLHDFSPDGGSDVAFN